MICDDSAIARKMVQRSLPDNFASEIHLAENGLEALQHLHDNQIALLFLDLTMPIMDGVELLQQIKKLSIEVFTIVISGDIQPEMRRRVAQLGALDFIEKPVDEERLCSTLQRFGLY